MGQVSQNYYKRDFWAQENLKYAEPHFRMIKAARLINKIAGGANCDLLDVGCGPGALMRLLDRNIHYYGIDMAIQEPAANFVESDFTTNPIRFGDKKFDLVVAQGVFEYIGKFQPKKLSEIGQLLNSNGTFLVSYVNFNHLNKFVYHPYNNIMTFIEFRDSLAEVFHIDRVIPTSIRWHHDEPSKPWMKAIQMHVNVNIPFITRLFAVEYFFVCSLPNRTSA